MKITALAGIKPRNQYFYKARNPKCNSPHITDADILMESIAGALSKIAKYSLENKEDFEALVKNSLAKGKTDETKKQHKRLPQITMRLAQIDKVVNKLYEDNALGTIDHESASGRAKKFIQLVESYCTFGKLTPTAINEFISKIVIDERDVKRARYAVQRVEVYFNYIGKFEDEVTEFAEPTEQECEQMSNPNHTHSTPKSRWYFYHADKRPNHHYGIIFQTKQRRNGYTG